MPNPVPHGRVTNRPSPVPEVHIIWMTSGLGCDGDSVSITAAMQPSIEDVVMGAIPGLPKVHIHNPVLAYEVGDDFLKYWHLAAARNGGTVRITGMPQPSQVLPRNGATASGVNTRMEDPRNPIGSRVTIASQPASLAAEAVTESSKSREGS